MEGEPNNTSGFCECKIAGIITFPFPDSFIHKPLTVTLCCSSKHHLFVDNSQQRLFHCLQACQKLPSARNRDLVLFLTLIDL